MVKKIALFLLFAVQIVSAQGIKVNAFTDKREYLIGDSIGLTYDIKFDDSLTVLNLDEQFLEEFETNTILPVKESLNGKTFRYALSVYDSNKITIPPVKVFYIQKKNKVDAKNLDFTDSTGLVEKGVKIFYTQPVNFLVNYVQLDTAQGFKDIRPPKTLDDGTIEPMDILRYIVLIASIIFIILAIRYFLKKRKKAIPEKVVEFIPDVWAKEELTKVEKKELWQKGLQKEYHSELTEIIRKYFEYIYQFPSLELTTDETLANLKDKKAGIITYDLTKEFLETADLVKFAKVKILDEYNKKMLSLAFNIVDSVKNELSQEINQGKTENV